MGMVSGRPQAALEVPINQNPRIARKARTPRKPKRTAIPGKLQQLEAPEWTAEELALVFYSETTHLLCQQL